MRVFVINLERSVDRRMDMDRQLRHLGTDYEIWSAVDGRAMDEPVYMQCGGAHGLFRGEVGCYLSHLSLWKKIRDEQIPLALILEDDARIDSDALTVVRDASVYASRFDVLRLSALEKQVGEPLAPLSGNRRLLVPMKNPSGLAGYVLTSHGAGKLVRLAEEIRMPIDTVVDRCWTKGVRMVMVSPAPIHHASGIVSTITDVKRHGLRAHKSSWCGRISRSVKKRLHSYSMKHQWHQQDARTNRME